MRDHLSDWHRPTPALAGRLQARGIPPAVFQLAAGSAILFGFAYRPVLSSYMGNLLGYIVAFATGAALGFIICASVIPLSRKDRDWWAIMCDWWRLRWDLFRLSIWKRFYGW